MARGFDIIEWDDFTGGHWVGPIGAKQPGASWIGDNVMVNPDDGTLMPAPPLVAKSVTGLSSYAPGGAANFKMSAPIHLGDYIVWAQQDAATPTYKVYRVSRHAGASTASTATMTGDPTARTYEGWYPAAHYDGTDPRCHFPNGTTSPVRYNATSNAVAPTTAPAAFDKMHQWLEFSLGVAANDKRLYFSNAGDPATWAGDFVDIGNLLPITAMIPGASQLAVGNIGSWHSVRGTLGAGASQVQIADALGPINQGAGSDFGIVYGRSVGGVAFYTLAGILPRPLHHRRPASGREMIATRAGLGTLIGFNPFDERVWILQNRQWRSLLVPVTVGSSNAVRFPVADPAGWGSADGRLWFLTVTGNGTTELRWHELAPTKPRPVSGLVTTPGEPNQATVRLAEYRRDSLATMRVRRCWMELELDTPESTGIRGAIAARARIITRGRAELPPAEALDSASSQLSWEGSIESVVEDGTRIYVEADVDDGGECTSFYPEITLVGCRLRRFAARIEQVA